MKQARRPYLPDRTHPLVFGVVVFLASELMLFGALLTAYYDLRASSSAWPPPVVRLDTVESSVGTAMLALSSLTMWLCTRNISRNHFTLARFWLGATIVLGVFFLAVAVHGWLHDTFEISTDAYGSVFYTLTGIHAAHVTVGVCLLLMLFWGIRMKAFNRDQRAGAEAIGYYWHFVMGAWILIFGSIYVIR